MLGPNQDVAAEANDPVWLIDDDVGPPNITTGGVSPRTIL